MEKQVTRLEAMKKRVQGEIITIPDWIEGSEINVRLRPVDLTAQLLAAGPLPPILAGKVREAFEGEAPSRNAQTSPEDVIPFLPILDALAREALVEPTYEQITTEVAPLTLLQKMAIFEHVTKGLQKTASFRRQDRGNDSAPGNGESLGGKTE